MITSQELSRSIHAALRLARGDASAVGLFNATLEGFWNSITAAVIVLPGYAFLVWLSYEAFPAASPTGVVLLVEAIAYVVHWTAFQLALFYYCQWIGKPDRFFTAAVALNWGDVPVMVAQVGIALLIFGGFPMGFGAFLLVALPLAYWLFVAHCALRGSVWHAVGPVAIAFGLGHLVRAAATGITGQG